jgi:hypothetical protein
MVVQCFGLTPTENNKTGNSRLIELPVEKWITLAAAKRRTAL